MSENGSETPNAIKQQKIIFILMLFEAMVLFSSGFIVARRVISNYVSSKLGKILKGKRHGVRQNSDNVD